MNSFLKRALGKEDAELFHKACRVDETILPLLTKLLKYKISELDKPATETEVASENWDRVRAYRDGGRHYLSTFLSMFEEK